MSSDPIPHMSSGDYERFVRDFTEKEFTGVQLGSPVMIQHNARVVGHSGHEHQIDVLVEFTLIGCPFRVLGECKNYTRKVGIDDVLTLKGRLADCAAQKAIIISATGFQRGALRLAKASGISLLVVHGHRVEYSCAHAFTNTRDELRELGRWLRDFFGATSKTSPSFKFTWRKWCWRDIFLPRFFGMPRALSVGRGNERAIVSPHDFTHEVGTELEPYDSQECYSYIVDDDIEVQPSAILKFLILEMMFFDSGASLTHQRVGPFRRLLGDPIAVCRKVSGNKS